MKTRWRIDKDKKIKEKRQTFFLLLLALILFLLIAKYQTLKT